MLGILSKFIGKWSLNYNNNVGKNNLDTGKYQNKYTFEIQERLPWDFKQ